MARSATTLKPMGSIMAAVAVLETNMLMMAVASMPPPIMLAGRVPTRRSVTMATRRSSPHRCMERARRNPPRKRKIRGSA